MSLFLSLVSMLRTVSLFVFCLMIRRPPRSTRTDTLFPYTTLFRSLTADASDARMNVFSTDNNLQFNFNTGANIEHKLLVGIDYSWNRIAKRYAGRSEEHTSELQSLMRISYAVFCLKKKKK